MLIDNQFKYSGSVEMQRIMLKFQTISFMIFLFPYTTYNVMTTSSSLMK